MIDTLIRYWGSRFIILRKDIKGRFYLAIIHFYDLKM